MTTMKMSYDEFDFLVESLEMEVFATRSIEAAIARQMWTRLNPTLLALAEMDTYPEYLVEFNSVAELEVAADAVKFLQRAMIIVAKFTSGPPSEETVSLSAGEHVYPRLLHALDEAAAANGTACHATPV
jgi:hypothetical protein